MSDTKDLTEFIEMIPTHIDDYDLSVIVGSKELTLQIQVRSLAMHGKTMLMMYEASNDYKYLKQAKLDYHRAKLLQEQGFVLSVDSNLAA